MGSCSSFFSLLSWRMSAGFLIQLGLSRVGGRMYSVHMYSVSARGMEGEVCRFSMRSRSAGRIVFWTAGGRTRKVTPSDSA